MVELNEGSLSDSRLMVLENNALLPSESRELWLPDQRALSARSMERAGSVQIINVDALKFLEQVPGEYDVVILDFPDPNAPELAKLYSRSFYRLLRSRLAPGGVVVQQATSPYYAKEAYLNIGRTIESAGFSALPYHDNVPSMGDWGWWLAGDSRWHSQASLRAQMQGADAGSIEVRYLTAEKIKASLAFGAEQLVTERQDINTLTSSVVYDYYVRGWEQHF